jgi:hypothetical protein
MRKKKWENPAINALTSSPSNRDVRVHDKSFPTKNWGCKNPKYTNQSGMCGLHLIPD